MAITRLERKGRKNKNVAKNRVNNIKRLNTIPAIKNVDIEEIKAGFAQSDKKDTTKKAIEEEKPVEVASSRQEIAETKEAVMEQQESIAEKETITEVKDDDKKPSEVEAKMEEISGEEEKKGE